MEQELPTAFWPLRSLFEGGMANSGSSPLPPCPETPHVAPPPAPSHLQSGQAWALGEFLPAKTAPLVRTSFAMYWEEGGRGGENLPFKHLHIFWKHLRRFQVLFARTNTFHHKMTLSGACRWLLAERIYIAWGHQHQAGSPASQAATHHRNQSSGYKPAPFYRCTEGVGAKEKPRRPPQPPLWFPSLHRFSQWRSPLPSQIPRCQHAYT